MIADVRNSYSSMFNTTSNTDGTNYPEPPVGAAEPSPERTLPTNPKGMGRDEFLKMLVAQLKNQDPLNPMDGKDMAAQLAQFSTVEQLLKMNESLDAQKTATGEMKDAIVSLEATQNERADELAQLIEGQMAMATVGKVGVTTGNTAFVDKDGTGQIVVDTGSLEGTGRITMINSKGEAVGQAVVGHVKAGQSSFNVGDYEWDPPLEPGQYTYKFDVAKDGGLFQSAKTYTVGRITGMKYENGYPMMIIGDALQVPMSQLIQIRA
ncbi:flagellar hook capping FlgD N-terminal domain-containing protein [Gemmatimonas aurantiaca]|uniref:flagellar hook assembly protein FlgD n=1 Tax=Gemmatimonas aurantiaca TaxID=173480 RepID=UPI00301CF8FC